MLTPLQKQCSAQFLGENFGLCEGDPETFLPRIITSGSITGSLKQNRSLYNDHDSPTPKKFWIPPVAGKIMAMVF
jgi:hypothetical protein